MSWLLRSNRRKWYLYSTLCTISGDQVLPLLHLFLVRVVGGGGGARERGGMRGGGRRGEGGGGQAGLAGVNARGVNMNALDYQPITIMHTCQTQCHSTVIKKKKKTKNKQTKAKLSKNKITNKQQQQTRRRTTTKTTKIYGMWYCYSLMCMKATK